MSRRQTRQGGRLGHAPCVRGRTGDTFDSPGACVLDSPARSAVRPRERRAAMIDKVARSLRKHTGRLLGAPVKPEEMLRRKMIARAYLRGDGIEIRALHDPLRVPRAARGRYVDRRGVGDLREDLP